MRFGYRGGPVAIFNLKEAININELLFCVQFFEYKQNYTRLGKRCEDITGSEASYLSYLPDKP